MLAACVLAQAQLHVVALELELREVVLAHHVENLFDFVEIHHQSASSSRGG